jgi:hypothetical protein
MDCGKRRLAQISTFALLSLLATSCAPSAPPPASAAGRLALAELPGLRAAADAQLQAELARLTQEEALPLQLVPAGTIHLRTTPRSRVDFANLTASERLEQALPPISRGLWQIRSGALYTGGPLRLSPVQIEQGRDLVALLAEPRARFREALPTEPGRWGPRLIEGMLADLGFLQPLVLGCRLESIAAAVSLADRDPERAIEHLEPQLLAASVLAAEPNVTMRLAAANLRTDALHLAEAIAAHPQATPATHAALCDLLLAHTADWPADETAWIGERAAGLLVYELVRDGQYLSLLSLDEVANLRERRTLEPTVRAVMRHLDDDQRFYLRKMRNVIEASRLPYYQRKEILAAIRRELVELENSSEYPLIAGQILLADLERAHLRQAEDRAATLGWIAALASASGRELSTLPPNPLTGQAIAVERDTGSVTVRDCALAAWPEIRIPLADRTASQTSPERLRK